MLAQEWLRNSSQLPNRGPRAPSFPAPSGSGKTSLLLRCSATEVVHRTPRHARLPTRSAENSGDSHNLFRFCDHTPTTAVDGTILNAMTHKAVVRAVIKIGTLSGFATLVGLSAPIPVAAKAARCRSQQSGMILHVHVTVRTPSGHSVGYLGPRDFEISHAGSRMPIVVRSPQYSTTGCSPIETRLLVIAGPELLSSPELYEHPVANLRPVLRNGWRVAVGEASGTATPYATSADALADMLRQRLGLQTDAAISELNGFSGRKVLLLLPEKANVRVAPIRDDQIQRAKDSLVDLFLVDGGTISNPTEDQNLIAVNRREAEAVPAAGAAVSFSPPQRLEKYSEGIFHEPSLREAVRAANRAGFGYYDLALYKSKAPDMARDGISLKVNKRPPLLVLAEASGQIGDQIPIKLATK